MMVNIEKRDIAKLFDYQEFYTGPDLAGALPEVIKAKVMSFCVNLETHEGQMFKDWLHQMFCKNEPTYSVKSNTIDNSQWIDTVGEFLEKQGGYKFESVFDAKGVIKSTGHEYTHKHPFTVKVSPIEIETNYMFGDQVNVRRAGGGNGLRLRDCTIFRFPNKNIFAGIIIIDESRALREARRKTYKCDFTGETVSFREAQALGFINKRAWLRDMYSVDGDLGIFKPLLVDDTNDVFKPSPMPTAEDKIVYRIKSHVNYVERLEGNAEALKAVANDRAKLLESQKQTLALFDFLSRAGLNGSSMLLRGEVFTPASAIIHWRNEYLTDLEKSLWAGFLETIDGFNDVRHLMRFNGSTKSGI